MLPLAPTGEHAVLAAINISGSFALGYAASVRAWRGRRTQLFIATGILGGFGIVAVVHGVMGPAATVLPSGFLGGFTTFSSVSVAAGNYWRAHRRGNAIMVMPTLFLGTLAGPAFAHVVFRPPGR